MSTVTAIGLLGSTLLVLGAAVPDRKSAHPAASPKNLLFAIGNVVMLTYGIGNWRAGGHWYFVLLEFLTLAASAFMLLGVRDTLSTPLLAAVIVGLAGWSAWLFQGISTPLFAVGLGGVGIGYAMEPGSVRRPALLCAGSALIAFFSFMQSSWIFFWLNLFFALLSGYYVVQAEVAKRQTRQP